MISEAVREESASFLQFWSKTFERSPFYELDGTFPSLRVLDLLLLPSRGMLDQHIVLERIHRGVSLCLAIYLHDTLVAIGRTCRIDFVDGKVWLEFSSAEAGRTIEVPLESALSNLVRSAPTTVQFFKNFSRDVSQPSSWLSSLALGILLESSPFIEGEGVEVNDELLEGSGKTIVNELARQCASCYARLFPDEQLGQVPELYLSRLVVPPFLFREGLPGLEAVRGLHQFMTDFSISRERMHTLTRNLMQFPDEQISASAFTFHVALHDGPVTSEMFGVSRRHGAFVGLLREALIEARRLLFQEEDWIMQPEAYSKAQMQMIHREVQLNFIPWLEFPAERLAEIPSSLPLSLAFRSLADFDFARAKSSFDSLCAENPADIDLRLQRLSLDYVGNDFTKAMAGARSLLSEPEAETSAAVLNFLGTLQLAREKVDEALDSFERARKFTGNDFALAGKVANNYAWALMCKERFSEALDVIDLSLSGIANNLIIKMNRVSALIALHRDDEAYREQQDVIRLSPHHHQVFFALCYPEYLRLGGAPI